MKAFIAGLFFVLLASIQPACAYETHSRDTVVQVPGGRIIIKFQGPALNLPDGTVVNWVKNCATAITSYYGKFPLKRTVVQIRTTGGKGVGFSTATSDDDNDGLVEVPLGKYTTIEDLEEDWILTHEMVHLNFPLMSGNKSWIAEGMATYVEPIARLQAGNLKPSIVWGDFLRDMEQGLPARGDRGLDYTPTWERTYWGGALFFFVADLEIRKLTHNRKGLQDALAAIARAGGNIGSDWSAEYCFAIGDRATGVPVLQKLYSQMRSKPVSFDLASIFRAIGVQKRDGKVQLDGDAPMAEIRRAIDSGTIDESQSAVKG